MLPLHTHYSKKLFILLLATCLAPILYASAAQPNQMAPLVGHLALLKTEKNMERRLKKAIDQKQEHVIYTLICEGANWRPYAWDLINESYRNKKFLHVLLDLLEEDSLPPHALIPMSEDLPFCSEESFSLLTVIETDWYAHIEIGSTPTQMHPRHLLVASRLVGMSSNFDFNVPLTLALHYTIERQRSILLAMLTSTLNGLAGFRGIDFNPLAALIIPYLPTYDLRHFENTS